MIRFGVEAEQQAQQQAGDGTDDPPPLQPMQRPDVETVLMNASKVMDG